MRIGLYLNLFGNTTGPPDLSAAVEQAVRAEQAGFSWLVLGDRHVHPDGYHEVVTSLTWLAAHTTRIGLATAGIILPVHQPMLLAEQLAHVDVLSGGRLTAGFVLGYRPEEFAMVGISQRERVARFEENLQVMERLWRGERVSYSGRHVTAHDAFLSPLPVQQPRPVIWNGGRVSAALERTARFCDGWSTSFNETVPDLMAKINEYRSYPAGANSLGKEVIVCREGFCAATAQQARTILESPLRALYGDYLSWKRTSPDAVRYGQPWEDIADRAVVGSPQQCVDTLAHYAELGADAVVLRVQPPELPQAETLRCLDMLGEHVLPEINADTGDVAG